jgi:hypothetical protein
MMLVSTLCLRNERYGVSTVPVVILLSATELPCTLLPSRILRKIPMTSPRPFLALSHPSPMISWRAATNSCTSPCFAACFLICRPIINNDKITALALATVFRINNWWTCCSGEGCSGRFALCGLLSVSHKYATERTR